MRAYSHTIIIAVSRGLHCKYEQRKSPQSDALLKQHHKEVKKVRRKVTQH